MHEIGMETLRPKPQISQQRMRPRRIERVPAHMRYLERRIVRRDRDDIACNPPEASSFAMFQAARRHQLHADTNAEERLAFERHFLLERFIETWNRSEAVSAITEGADSRKHDPLGLAQGLGIGRDLDLGGNSIVRRGALEGFGGRVKIARP